MKLIYIMIKSLSIIFPVFNEELRLKSSFSHIASFLKKKKNFKIEIIFIDDGSKDNSYNLITQFVQNLKTNNRIKIKVIKSKRNLGKGSALKLGVKKAKHDWILTTDIDMSVSLFQFSNWMKKKLIHRKYFVYFGSRTHQESIVKENIFRNMLGHVMRFCISTILNIKIKDTQCGYKLYKKKVARLIFSKLKNRGFEHDVELVLLLKSKQIEIRELPVKWVHKSSSSLNILWDPVKMLVGIFLLKFRKF